MASLEGVTLSLRMGPVVASPVPPFLAEALTAASAHQAVGQRSGFQLTFQVSKTSQVMQNLLPQGYFDPMIRVILIATLNGVPMVLADGPIKRVDLTASVHPGEYMLTVSGEDVSGYMDAIDLTGFPYPAMPSFARVALMMAKYAMFGVIPMTIPSPFSFVASPTEKYPHQQGTDFEYADKLAKDEGYEFYVTPGPSPGMNTAYWGPSVRVGRVQPALTVDMDGAAMTESMSFTTDGANAILPYGFVKVANVSIPVPVPDIGILKPPLALRPVIPTRTKLLETERMSAPEVMGALLAGRGGMDPVTASGAIDLVRYGRPLEARSLVAVRGAGLAHDGVWFVRSVTHALTRGSWNQNFQLSREGLVSQQQQVPV